MSDEIRFHCDENVPTAIADGLRQRGVFASPLITSAKDSVAKTTTIFPVATDAQWHRHHLFNV